MEKYKIVAEDTKKTKASVYREMKKKNRNKR